MLAAATGQIHAVDFWATVMWTVPSAGVLYMVIRYITEDARNRERLLQAFRLAGGGDRRVYSYDNRCVLGLTQQEKAIVIATMPRRKPVVARFYGPERIEGVQLELNREIVDIIARADSDLASAKLVPYAHAAAGSEAREFTIRIFVDDPDFHELRFPISEVDGRRWLDQFAELLGVEPALPLPAVLT